LAEYVHFIGIGGISMSGIAKVLLNNGIKVSGSDISESDSVKELKSLGAEVFIGHNASNITNQDLVVYTSAVKDDNPEIVCAKQKGIELIDRATMLGRIMKNYKTAVSVAGTHGKTTATSMLAYIMLKACLDPTVMVGGKLDGIDGNLRIGKSEYFLTETCEYMRNFLKFFPTVAVILNVDGKNVFRYIDDTTSQIKKKGEFLIYATPGHSVEIAPAETVSSKSDYDALIKTGYVLLQQKYFETVKTVSDNSIMMKVNCKNYVTDEGVKTFEGGRPVIYGGKTLVPLRTISEFFNAEVNWDEVSRSAVINVNENRIEFFENKNTYTVNGEEKMLEQVPIIKDGTLLVPLRDISESIGKEVYWHERGIIIIGTNQKVDTPNKQALFKDISETFENMNVID